tara:strand:+ start:1435 stop:2130 length:696 start_codon:yes stop_codon:yes gene_type:complete
MLGGWTPALAEGPSHQPFNYPYLQLPDSAFIESLGKDGVKGATGHIMMVGGIYDNTFQEMRQSLLYFKNRGIKNITITLHSQGGSPFSAFSMVQLLKMYQRIHGFNVTIIGFGQVASAACIVMQGASTGQRILMEGGIFMMHDLQIVKFSFGLTFQSVTDQAQEADRDKFIQHKYWKFFSDIMGKTVKETAQLFQNELWMVPKRAVELGLADKVIPTPLVQLPTKEYPDTE